MSNLCKKFLMLPTCMTPWHPTLLHVHVYTETPPPPIHTHAHTPTHTETRARPYKWGWHDVYDTGKWESGCCSFFFFFFFLRLAFGFLWRHKVAWQTTIAIFHLMPSLVTRRARLRLTQSSHATCNCHQGTDSNERARMHDNVYMAWLCWPRALSDHQVNGKFADIVTRLRSRFPAVPKPIPSDSGHCTTQSWTCRSCRRPQEFTPGPEHTSPSRVW